MAIAVAVVAPTMALADSGDGKIACNTGEICFARDDASVMYQKHFWYGASHDNYYFWDTVENDADGSELKNNADQVRNRDRTCDVKVIDDRGLLPDDVQTIPNNGVWTPLKDSVDNENDRHERVC